MRKIVCLIFLSTVFTLQTSAQSKKNRKKSLPVRAVVNVQTDAATETKLPSEENEGIWNEYISEKYNFNIIFPTKSVEVWDENIDKLITFEANTKKAAYRLMIKNLPVNLSNAQLDEVYEASFSDVLSGGKVRLISKKNVYLNRKLGREFVYAERKKIYFQRLYILEGKLFFLTISLPEKEYSKSFDKWASKFFESFSVEAHDNSIG